MARSTTAIELSLALLLAAAPAAAGDDVGRLLTLAAAYAPSAVPADAIRTACGDDALCAARAVAARIGPRARLQPVVHPDTDSIRWVTSAASLTRQERLAGGRLLLALDRFGRKADRELAAAAQDATGLVLDLRGNRGGDLDRMLRVAALFTGPRLEGVVLDGPAGRVVRAVPEPIAAVSVGPLTVLVGPRTASSGELLAALLRRYAGAAVLGTRTAGKTWLYRVVPVDHDWRLLLPAETVAVPGEDIAGGLRPDGPLPADWTG